VFPKKIAKYNRPLNKGDAMKRIQTQKAVLLSLLFSSALFADIHDRIEYKLSRVLSDLEEFIVNGNTSSSCIQITQADLNRGGGVYTIIQSGEYCVAENLTGLIVINADSVCIDLQCHIVSAGGNASAFSVSDQSGIKISNGTVANAGDAGILAASCNAVELFYLYFVGNANDAIRLNSCTESYVHNVNVFGGAGNSAVALLTCSNAVVENCEVTGYSGSVAAGIIDIISGECVVVRSVDVCDCVFNTQLADVGGIHIANSTNVVIEHSSAHNISPLSNTNANGILIDTCVDCKVIGSQVHGNDNSGVRLINTNTTIAIIECLAMENDNAGFDFDGGSTDSCCLVQDCRAIGNGGTGFFHGASLLETTFIGNEAQCNNPNYDIIGGTIGLQRLSWFDGSLAIISGNADLGARFTNITIGGGG
jgi:hypothetical protein